MNVHSILLPALATLLAGSALAQGNTCGTATPINTEGQWTWDSGSFSYNPPPGGAGCEIPSTYWDAYFQWTAPADGDYQFSTVGATWDTYLAVYSGVGCSATCLAVNTTPGSFFSFVEVQGVLAGETFLLRSATLGDSHPGYGGLTIRTFDPACGIEADDRYEQEGYVGNNLTAGTYDDLLVRAYDVDQYTFCVRSGGSVTLDVLFSHAQGNVNVILYREVVLGGGTQLALLDSSFSGSDNEFVNWYNDTGANSNVVASVRYLDVTSDCVPYEMVLGGVGNCSFNDSTFCDPMDPNTSGQSTRLRPFGSGGLQSGLHLAIDQGPPNQFGYMHVGTGMTDPGLPIGDGRFCLAVDGGNRYGRYNVAGTLFNSLGQFDGAGRFVNLSGTSGGGFGYDVPHEIPMPGLPNNFTGMVGSGTWHYQMWHRDSNGSSNFSNGLSVTY